MATFSEVNPGNTSEIWPADAQGIRYIEGASNLTTNAGLRISRLFAAPPAPVSTYNVYLEDDQTTPPPGPAQYYDSLELRSFAGPLGNPASLVTVTSNHVRIPTEDLLDIKQGEREVHASVVALQSVRSVGNNNFWIALDVDQRRAISSYNEFLTDRHKDRSLGPDSTVVPQTVTDPTTYWPRDFPILLIRDSNGVRIISDVDEGAWGQVLKDKGGYDTAIRDASVAVQNAFNAAIPSWLADGTEVPAEWDALAAIDVTDPAYGWPTYYTGTQSVGVRIFP